MKKIILTIIFSFAFFNEALAYLDPGTGSAILQALIAAIAAGYATMTDSWRKIKEFCGIKTSKKKKIEKDKLDN